MDEKFCFKVVFLSSIFILYGCAATPIPSQLKKISTHQQVLIVQPIQPKSSLALMTAWQGQGSSWQRVFKARAVLGRNGLAELNTKQEGDGHTPQGEYLIGTAFGYDPAITTGLNYRQATQEDFWVDDAQSAQYNQWVRGKPQANSFEHMKREDNLYSLGAVIEYNTDPIVPGKGSAIFLHIWRAYYKPTAGCVALSKRNIRKLLQWLNQDKNPIIILAQK